MVDYKYKDLFLKSHVDKQLRIATDDGLFTATNPDINWENFELAESICSESELRFGSCEASMVKFQIRNAFIPLAGKWLTVTETLDGNTDVPFQYGRYKVFSDVPTADKEYRDITAYDAMYDILNADMAAWYNSVLPNENSTVTLREFRTSFIRHFGLEEVLPEGGLVNDGMTVQRTIQPEQISGKDIITAICEINGCFGHIGRDGKFHYIYLPQAIEGLYPANDLYPDHAPEWMVQAKTGHLYPQDPQSTRLGTGRYIKCQYEDYRTKRITKMQIRQRENDIGLIYGDGDSCYIIQDNFLVYGKSSEQLKVIAENIFGKITDIVYRPFDATCVGNPCLEVGDSVRIPTKYEIVESYILKRTMKGIQALQDSYAADGAEMYTEKLNGVQKSIIQLKGKSNILERTIEETRLEMRDEDSKLSNEITVTAKEIRGELKDEVNGLNNTISATAGEIRGELQDTKSGLENQISITAEGLENSIRDTKGGLETEISATAGQIRTEISQTYETKSGAQAQYNSLSTNISQTSKEISAEVNRATAAEGNLSSQLQLLAGQIVLKADANGRMVLVALNANPSTGSEFKVDADNINLSANDVMNLMAGGTLNLSAMNINISSNNFSVDSQGNVICNNLSAVTFTGRAINDLNNAIWNSETMRRVNEIIEIFDKKLVNIESILYDDKTLFDTLDSRTDAYAWSDSNFSVVDSDWLKASPGSSLRQYTVIDASGYNKIVCRIYAKADGGVSGPHVANHFYIKIGATNEPASASTVLHKADAGGGGAYEGAAKEAWYNLVIDVSGLTSKTSIPINVFYSRQASPDNGWHLYCSRITLTNQ